MINLSERKKHRIIVIGAILLPITILVFIANLILGNIIEKKLKNSFSGGDNKSYQLSVDKVRTNILSGSIRLSNFELIPDSTLLVETRQGNAPSTLVFEFKIAELQIVRLNLISALIKKQIDIGKIELKNPEAIIYKGKEPKLPIDTPKIKFDLDSFQIKGFFQVKLEKIILNHSKITSINLITSDTIIVNKALKTEIKGLELIRISKGKDLFKLHLKDFAIEVNDEQVWLPGGDYRLALKRLNFEAQNSELILNNLTLIPIDEDFYRLARERHFTSEIFNIDVDKIRLNKLNPIDIINHRHLLIDSLLVSGLNLSILMDKRLPFNTDKRPQLPDQLLKSLNIPLYIGEIQIDESNLTYQERMPDIKEPMTVTMNNLNIDIRRTTSIKDSISVRKNMTIELQSDLMDKARFHLNIVFPLYLKTDTFFYTGHMGPANLNDFNKASIPAIGARFVAGKLKSITFKGSANSTSNTGEFTMLYDNLEAEIAKKDYITKNKIISWAANTALHSSNPSKKGKIRVAEMQTTRDPSKGFGNFMWKTFENGIISTVSPVGKKKKIEQNK